MQTYSQLASPHMIAQEKGSACDPSRTTPFQPFWDMAIAPLKLRAVHLALSVRLFESLTTPASAPEIARRHDLHPASTGPWLDLLWSLGLVDRLAITPQQDGTACYVAAGLATDWFTDAGARACREAWQFRTAVMAGFADELEGLLHGGPATLAPPPAPAGLGWSEAARKQIAQEQAALSVPSFQNWLTGLDPLPPRGRFLDLGGGPGLIASAFAQAMPGWSVHLFDLPQTAAVAEENFAAAGLDGRATAMGGDLDRDDFGIGYDLIWCSSVLHFVRDPQSLLERVHAALNPGGQFVAAHAERPDDSAEAGRILPYYLPMALRGRHVPGSGAIKGMMAQAGVVDIVTDGWLPFPMAPVCVHRGRRA